MIPPVPGEETPLLDCETVSATRRIVERESEAAALASPSNFSRTLGVKSRKNVSGRSRVDVVNKTPLPWVQFSITLFLLFAELLASYVISPFAPELVRSLGVAKSEAEVGYYVGVLHSVYYAAQASTSLHWGRLSDHIGRKPVILAGLLSVSLSMYCFALSTTFWGFALSRALGGALNGNLGVIKSIIAELTDNTNLALAYSYQPIASATGTVLGATIGGTLSRPAERFPNFFSNKFLKEYPYFLPCAVSATFAAVVSLVAFLFQKETHSSPKSIQEFLRGESKQVTSEADSLLASETPSQEELEKPVPWRDLLTRDVIVASANYSFLALIEISFRTLQPIFLATPIALGGLGLDPPVIGTIISFVGILNGTFNIFFFSRMVDHFGVKWVYLMGAAGAVPCFSLFPIINHLARKAVEGGGGLGVGVWIAVGLQEVMAVLMCSCYGAVFIFIAAAAPNEASLGATNGFAQLSASFVRAVGPALASLIYSLSIDEGHHYMGGWFVYYVTVALSLGTILVGSLLPKCPLNDMG